MLPILVFEVARKLTWLGLVALPAWMNDTMDQPLRTQVLTVTDLADDAAVRTVDDVAWEGPVRLVADGAFVGVVPGWSAW